MKRTRRKIWKLIVFIGVMLFIGYQAVFNGTNLETRTLFQRLTTKEQHHAETINPSKQEGYETGTVTHVADGDTLTVDLEGKSYKVRMIGIDTPESVHVDASKNTKWGKTASKYTKKHIKIGQTVYLTKDQSDTDRYGRLLRIVWTKKPVKLSITKSYNAQLLKEGMARAASYHPDTTYSNTFKSLEEKARNSKIGLWKDSRYCDYIDANH